MTWNTKYVTIHIWDPTIGASLSEPHTYVVYATDVCMWIYMFICMYRMSCQKFLFDPAKMFAIRKHWNIHCRKLHMMW